MGETPGILPKENRTNMNVLVTLINSIFGDVLDGVTALLSGETGQVIVGFVSIALLLALVVYVKKTFQGSKA